MSLKTKLAQWQSYTLILIIITASSAITAWHFGAKPYLAKMQENSDEKIVKTLIGSYFTAIQATYAQTGDMSVEDIGFTPVGTLKHQIYGLEKDVPAKYRKFINQGDLPYRTKDTFQVLVIGEIKEKNKVKFWVAPGQTEGTPFKNVFEVNLSEI